MSELATNKISPVTGTNVTLGDSGDTFTIASGASISGNGSALTTLTAGNLTGALPAISGASLTNLPAGGKVLQVIGTTGTSSTASTSSTSWANYDTLGSITPASTSNKILIFLDYTMYSHTGGADTGASGKIVRGSTDIGHTQTMYIGSGGTPALSLRFTNLILDSPSSTSAVTYDLYQRAQYGGTVQLNSPWTCVLIEVEG